MVEARAEERLEVVYNFGDKKYHEADVVENAHQEEQLDKCLPKHPANVICRYVPLLTTSTTNTTTVQPLHGGDS